MSCLNKLFKIKFSKCLKIRTGCYRTRLFIWDLIEKLQLNGHWEKSCDRVKKELLREWLWLLFFQRIGPSFRARLMASGPNIWWPSWSCPYFQHFRPQWRRKATKKFVTASYNSWKIPLGDVIKDFHKTLSFDDRKIQKILAINHPFNKAFICKRGYHFRYFLMELTWF